MQLLSQIDTEKPSTRYTITGINADGVKFRPSDWTERLVCTQPHQIKKYNGQLKISRRNNARSIIFTDKLNTFCPITFERIIAFAKINNLPVSTESI